MSQVRIIAEAGVNHNGSIERALEMVDAAAQAGADTIKFQSFNPDLLVVASAAKAEYQMRETGDGSQLAMLRTLHLDRAAHQQLIARCETVGIGFLSSPFDVESVEMLASLGVQEFKIASGEITDLPVLRAVAQHAESALLSTGMATMDEVDDALTALETAGLERARITLLHCTSEYPAPYDEVNLRAMVEMGRTFSLPVGYSDHTSGIEVSMAAAALGAVAIEKHFTLDRGLPGPDHAASLEPDELASLVGAVDHVAEALGDTRKTAMPSEKRNAPYARKSIVAARDIAAGELLTEENLTAKRPGTGLSPMLWDSVVGTRAGRSFSRDEMIAQ